MRTAVCANCILIFTGSDNRLSSDIYVEGNQNASSALSSLVGSSSSLEYFSLPVELGPDGIKAVHSLGQVNDYEKGLLEACVAELKGSIEKGQQFVANKA